MNPFAKAIDTAFEEHRLKKARGEYARPKNKGGKINIAKMFDNVSRNIVRVREEKEQMNEAISRSNYYRSSVHTPLFTRVEEVDALGCFNKKGRMLFRCDDCRRSVRIRSPYGLLHCRFCKGEHTLVNAHYYFSPTSFPKHLEKDLRFTVDGREAQ